MNITPILVMNIHNSVGLNICLYFWSYSPSLNNSGNKTEKNLSVLISFGLKKSVGLNILVESVLIFLVLVTGPNSFSLAETELFDDSKANASSVIVIYCFE